MNICITNIEGAPQFIGGIKRVSATLGNQWQKAGHNVSFITFCTSDLHYDEICGIPQLFLPNSEIKYCQENIECFVEYIADNKIDILLNQFVDDREFSRLCVAVKEKTGVKLISSYHFADNHFTAIRDESFFCRSKPGYNFRSLIIDGLLWAKYHILDRGRIISSENNYFKRTYDNSDRFVILVDRTRLRIIDRIKRTSCSKLVAINNPNSFTEVKNDIKKENIIVWVGRIEYGMKRVDRIISVWSQVCREFPDWKLQILGGGAVAHFQKIISQKKIENIEFVGFVDPREYYEKASIVAMTSCTEGWGMVLVEGQQNGSVPIAYDSYCALQTITNNGNSGVSVTPFNEKEYVNKLRELMANDEYRDRLSAAARESVKRFDAVVIAKQWEDMFNELLA